MFYVLLSFIFSITFLLATPSAYIVGNNTNTLFMYDINTPSPLLTLKNPPTLPLADPARFVLTTPNGKFLYAASALGTDGAARVYMFSINQVTGVAEPIYLPGTETAYISESNSSFFGLAATENNQTLYVASPAFTRGIRVYDIDSNGLLTFNQLVTLATVLGVVPGPFELAISPDGTSLYSANSNTSTIGMLNIAPDGTLTAKSPASIATGTTPNCIKVSPDGKNVYTGNQGDNTLSLYSVDTATGLLTNIGTMPNASQPVQIVISPDGKFLYTNNFNPVSINIYERNTTSGSLSLLTQLPIDAESVQGLALSSDGRLLYSSSPSEVFNYTRNPTTGMLTLNSISSIPGNNNGNTNISLLNLFFSSSYLLNFPDNNLKIQKGVILNK